MKPWAPPEIVASAAFWGVCAMLWDCTKWTGKQWASFALTIGIVMVVRVLAMSIAKGTP